jgi:hypothetical protein
MKSIEIKLQQKHAPHVVKILSAISKEMPAAEWQQIKKDIKYICLEPNTA